MNELPILQRHPALRWLAPVGVLCVAGLAAAGMFSASASSERALPRTTPAALLAAVQKPDVAGFSGTLVSHLSLGLPELPDIGNAGNGMSFSSLLSGSHTLQVWYGGVDKERVALLGSTEETDVFRDGAQLWEWSSADKTAVHTVLPARLERRLGSLPVPSAGTSLTPAALARQALGALDPSTAVTVHAGQSVADRSTYDLVLTPRTDQTKVGSVHIAVDGATKVPLGVQVYARDDSAPSIDVSFTSIVFGHQSDRDFQFTPPPGATVHTAKLGRGAHPDATDPKASAPERGASTVTPHGSGWTTVLALQSGSRSATALRKQSVLSSLTRVSGTWGSGRLLDSDLFSVLVTDDGRVLVGAVAPSQLYAAAGTK